MFQKTFFVTVKNIIQETKDTITLIFHPSPHLLSYQAGQFITLNLTLNNELLDRSYSLCTSPQTDPFPAITIKRVQGGKVSNYLNDNIKVGDQLEIKPVAGNFVLPPKQTNPFTAIFIAGGSGITPILSMIKALLYQKNKNTALLIYASRNTENIIYKKTLEVLERLHPSRLKVIHNLSQPHSSWNGLKGRLTIPILKQLIQTNALQQKEVHYFLCGPKGLMELAHDALEELNINPTYVHQERFYTPTKEPIVTQAKTVTFHYQNEKNVCNIAPGQNILDLALENAIDIPFSCNSGTCNSCKAKCIKGKVNMLEDEGLSEEERKQGYVLTCVGFPATPEVELVIEDQEDR